MVQKDQVIGKFYKNSDGEKFWVINYVMYFRQRKIIIKEEGNGFLCCSIWKIRAWYAAFYGTIGFVTDSGGLFQEAIIRIPEDKLCFSWVLCDRKKSMEDFASFIGALPLVGYNVKFDIKFLEKEFCRLGLVWKNKRCIDILSLVKKEKLFLENYKLSNVLKSYGIDATVQHRAFEDVMLLAQLIPKLNEFEPEIRKKRLILWDLFSVFPAWAGG